MPTSRARDRIFPCLLDRLTDHYPRAIKESREHRSTSLRQYRESVLRDLSWLLNSTVHVGDDNLEQYELARNSVLNYGTCCLSGTWASTRNARSIEREVKEAILRFEPRLLPGTLRVSSVSTVGETGCVLRLAIEGVLWAEPVPERLLVETEVDLETGQCTVAGE